MEKSRSSYVMCILPKAGLGNQLFSLMKAVTFANIHQLPLKVIGFHQVKIGPYLRGEKIKRQYSNYFKIEENILYELWNKIQFKYLNHLPVEIEPELGKPIDKFVPKNYLYKNIPHWSDYFSNLKEQRQEVFPLLWNILSEKVKQDLERLNPPVIGVHIRMGDFRKLATHEDFSKVGAVRTPEDYFIDIIQTIRKINGTNLPVSIFTDGYAHELKNILSLPEVTMIEGNSDIVDLLLLSKSKIIVTSAGSTFSYWAGFLSDAPLILHPDHIHKTIRGKDSKFLYEGALDIAHPLLIEQLIKITHP